MSVTQSGSVSYLVRVAVVAALGATSMVCVPTVWAADEGPPAAANPGASSALAQITVTGSRIRRPDMEATSPTVTVDAEQLETRSGLNIESYLNQLPNFNPATTPTTGNADVQSTAVNSVGISTISLRGFGPNRSLVLVDGHRTTPVNPLMVTDVNSIPTAMIDRVEIISGGASAVYGADAIGGVTNFILKKNFQGLQVDVQDGITQAGDGNELRATVLMGTKIGDGRGNIILGAEYYDRRAAYQKNRDFYTEGWSDPGIGGQYLYLFGTNGINTVSTPPSKSSLNALFPTRGTATTPYVQALKAAAADGVDVRLLLPNGTDIPLLKQLSRAGYRPLLEAGVRVFEWNGTMLHAKTAVADGHWARVGSSNLNLASWLSNCELDAIIEDEQFAQEMEVMYLRDLANATEIVLDSKQKVRAPGEPRHPRPTTSGGGSAGRAAAGAIRLSNTIGAAFTNRRVLDLAEARMMTLSGILLLGLAILFTFFPKVPVYPAVVLLGWMALALLYKGYRLYRQRSRERRTHTES